MTNDIVERLRIMDAEEDTSFLRLDAVDEIESLRSRLAEAEAQNHQMREAIAWACGEREKWPEEPPPLGGKYRRRYYWRNILCDKAFGVATPASASGVQYKPCEICTTQSWCETHGCQCYPTEAMCCVDYPRCDCNSPPEPDNLPCGHPASLLLMSAETGEALYCELCDDKSGRRDAEQCETELRAEVERLKTALKTVGDDYPGSSCQQWCYEAAGIRAPAEWPTREEAEKRAAELMAIGRATLGENDDWLCFQRPAQPKVTP